MSSKRVQTGGPRKRRESQLCRDGWERELPGIEAVSACFLNAPGLRQAVENQPTETLGY